MGLASGPIQEATRITHHIQRGGLLQEKHWGDDIDDFLTIFGYPVGLPRVVGHAAKYGTDVMTGTQIPRGPSDVFLGITRGVEKRGQIR